jgi:glucose-1-phosphate thymidylyltransferase
MSKGVILCGGTGSRLSPLTITVNKHLLPVYNKPMVYYPIEFLRDSGIKDLLIILGGNSCGDFVNLLKDGEELGVSITYKFQATAGGIASAIKLARDFVGDESFVVCLGDNIFEFPIPEIPDIIKEISLKETPCGAICIHPTNKPSSFGVPTFDESGKITKITEKPEFPDSNFAVTGLYIYNKSIWTMIDSLKPSKRNETEITDVNNFFIQNGELLNIKAPFWWHDAGSIPALMECSKLVEARENAAKK